MHYASGINTTNFESCEWCKNYKTGLRYVNENIEIKNLSMIVLQSFVKSIY